jgi:hypothetical protein
MNRLPPLRRLGAAALLPLLAACTAEVPASLLLTITGAAGAPAPEAVQVRTFDGAGPLQMFTSFPAPAPQPDGRLGTVVIYPARGGDGSLRIQAQGLREGAVVSQGTARAKVAAGRQTTATLTLRVTPAPDGDRDGVPDEIDNCVAVANDRQDDANEDGKGDACSGSVPIKPTIAVTADAAVPTDAGCACEVRADPAPLGAPCATGADCRSSFCADGVCCEAADCGGPCRACNLPGAGGACRDLPADSAPRAGGCPTEPVTSCGRTGKCDGAGACQRHPAGTTCAPARCADGMETAPSLCGADGACRAGRTRVCSDGFSCKGDACATSCSTEAECTLATYCLNGACRPRRAAGASCKEGSECATGFCTDGLCCIVPRCAAGAWCRGSDGICVNKRVMGDPCVRGPECTTGFCVDGICCESACTDTCKQCADPTRIGQCVPIAAGLDYNASSPCMGSRQCMAGVCK